MHALFCTFFLVSAVQKLLKSVKIWVWQSGSQMYTATFYKPRQKSRFWYFQVRCTHTSGDVVNFIIVAYRISSRLKWYKSYKNRLRLAKVIVKNKMSRFYGSVCIGLVCVCVIFEEITIKNRSQKLTDAQLFTVWLVQHYTAMSAMAAGAVRRPWVLSELSGTHCLMLMTTACSHKACVQSTLQM